MQQALVLAFGASALAFPHNNRDVDNAKDMSSLYNKLGVKPVASVTTVENGIGSGVTDRIPPSAAPPAGCSVAYPGVFGLAVVNPQVKLAAVAQPAKAASAAASAGLDMFPGLGAFGGAIQKPSQAAAPTPTTPAQVPAAATANVKVQHDDPNDTTSVTSKVTRTQTRTVTVRRTVVGAKPMIASDTARAHVISQIGDGQLQQPTAAAPLSITTHSPPGGACGKPGCGGSPSQPVNQISDGQINIPQSTVQPVNQIGDGQIQGPVCPNGKGGCGGSHGQPVNQIGDGQIQGPVCPNGKGGCGGSHGQPVNQIGDGQVQHSKRAGPTGHPVNQIGDGQIQGPGCPGGHCEPVNQIGDGQIQEASCPGGHCEPVNQIGDGQIQHSKRAGPTGHPVNQIGDGQIQEPGQPINQIGDGQIQGPGCGGGHGGHGGCGGSPGQPISQIGDGQIQGPHGRADIYTLPVVEYTSDLDTANASTQVMATSPAHSKRQLTPERPAVQLVTCKKDGTLQVTLQDGVLKDNKNRIGYIASNYQFQFDGPPQSGAIYTAGWSVCSNGSLALGGSTVFWSCLSGDFSNLYDRWWAEQCTPVTINALMLKDC